ncbi:ArsR/SmtB family transcription factor [Sediminitomix flava]|uniref:ArsR family transcriptional regulator n=1 Tax=Sediminitomix flava TaxID=379075 RepID=A0A315Z054_SEDFL|nr:metalloregulator ArsR/SmtB family transcription factor [Sediminitomix flava]PWJ36047.1 ArsR family transcriptional regulator [Sediminitomix flava]
MKLKHFNLSLGTQIMKAFSEESRIRIMHLLFRNKELCISDIELILDFTQTKTSRHLIYLKNAGLVTSRKVDQWTFYSIKEGVLGFIEVLFNYLEKDPMLVQDQSIFETLYNNRELALCKLEARKWR